jgi:hypothetical protein
MPEKKTMSSSTPSVKPRPNATHRRAAAIAAAADKQPQLKREAAQRRAERAQRDAETPPQPLNETAGGRPRAR